MNQPARHPSSKYDLLSFVTTPVELSFNGKEVAHGTGFIWRARDKIHLITNWHNVTGVHPFEGEHLNAGGCVPDSITFHPAHRTFFSGNYAIFRTTVTQPLYEHFEEPFWIQHQQFDANRIDIIALEISHSLSSPVTMQDMGFENLFTHVGADVFVVGYPFRDYKDPYFPLWKRGSIASEPLALWNERPAFLVDAASRPGMSGSPVFRRAHGPTSLLQPDGSIANDLNKVLCTQFTGVYSGHLTTRNETLTIGIAWHGDLVSELLANPARGTRG